MILLPAQPAPDIQAVKRSPRSTRACDPRAPPRWHGCLQVSACTYTKKRKYSTVHELLRRGALAHARARDLLVCVWRGATRVASDACSRLYCLRVRMAARIRWHNWSLAT